MVVKPKLISKPGDEGNRFAKPVTEEDLRKIDDAIPKSTRKVQSVLSLPGRSGQVTKRACSTTTIRWYQGRIKSHRDERACNSQLAG